MKYTVNKLQLEISGLVSWDGGGGLLREHLWFGRLDGALFDELHGVGVGGHNRVEEEEPGAGVDGVGEEHHVVGENHQHYEDHKFVHRMNGLRGLQMIQLK